MMRFLPFIACVYILALSGCTSADWERAMTYTGFDDEPSVAVAPTVRPAPAQSVAAPVSAPDNSFCQAVAQQDAAQNGFDAATQQHVFQRSFQQCVAQFGQPRGALASN